MSEESILQKEKFLQEVEQKLLRKELDAGLLEDGLLHVKWNGNPLCAVDQNGAVRFCPDDIRDAETDRQLRTIVQTAAQTNVSTAWGGCRRTAGAAYHYAQKSRAASKLLQ